MRIGPADPSQGSCVNAADGKGVDDFSHHLFSGESRLQNRPEGPAGLGGSIELPLKGLSSPPRDLEQTLPQQQHGVIEACYRNQ